MRINILHISPQFNYACGVSKHVFTILNAEEAKKNFNFYYITNGGDAIGKLERAGIKYSLLKFSTDKIFRLDFFRTFISLRAYCIENNISVIHSHHRYPALIAHLVAKSLKIKTVVTAHNFVHGFRIMSYKADTIIAVSQSVKNHLCSYFSVAKEKVNVLYNCVRNELKNESSELNLKNYLKIPETNKIILFAGRIIQEKGVELLVEAYKKVSSNHKSVELILLGETNLPFKVLSQIENNERIHLIPQVENPDMYFRISDIIVLPSINEPLGYTMLEAGLFKIPFIGSNSGGIAEFIEDEKDGYLFCSSDAVKLADKIKFILDHPIEARQVATNLHNKVMHLCNCEKYFEKLFRIYSDLI